MTLSDHQWEFLQNVALLIQHAARRGYKLTSGRVKQYEGDVHYTPTSSHNNALAIDLNLFEQRNGRWVYLTSTESHAWLGMVWEWLSPYNRWGGRFDDGNHYERLTVSKEDEPQRWA